MKKINFFAMATVGLALSFCVSPFIKTKKAGAISDYVQPYFSAFLSDETKGEINGISAFFDMREYGGGMLDNVPVVTEYELSNVQAGAEFCVPVMATPNELQTVEILVDGKTVSPRFFYGDTPLYYAKDGVAHMHGAQESVATAQPTEIADGVGTLYLFETGAGALELSFDNTDGQSVFHSGFNSCSQGINGYALRVENTVIPYELFVSDGELLHLQTNRLYTKTQVEYKDFVDERVGELIADKGEAYRGVIYSRFNRALNDRFEEISDLLFYYNDQGFALLKTELPAGAAHVSVQSFVKPLVNTVSKPHTYLIRTVSLSSKECDYSLSLKTSAKIPYVLETNYTFSDSVYVAAREKEDGYFIVCSVKNPVSAEKSAEPKNKTGAIVGLACMGVVLVGCVVVVVKVWRG